MNALTDFTQKTLVEEEKKTIEGYYLLQATPDVAYIFKGAKGIGNTSLSYAHQFSKDTNLYFTGEQFTIGTNLMPETTYRTAILHGDTRLKEVYVITHPDTNLGELLDNENETPPEIQDAVDKNKKRAEALLRKLEEGVYFL